MHQSFVHFNWARIVLDWRNSIAPFCCHGEGIYKSERNDTS